MYTYSDEIYDYIPSFEYNTDTDYYYQPTESDEFEYYQPTQVSWTTHYEIPSVNLYYYDTATNDYYIETEPSPYLSYYFYNENTSTYDSYNPNPV